MRYEFNPPLIEFSRGGYRRNEDLNSGARDDNRAYLIQDATSANIADWVTTAPQTDGKNTIQTNTSLLAKGGLRYGFQFHYNPVQIDNSLGLSTEVDLAMMTSSTDKATPWAMPDQPGGVSLSIQLNRVEDMNVLNPDGSIKPEVLQAYGDPYRNKTNDAIRQQIYLRGTGIDLEYLFRCLLGRPYKTKLRNLTADIGIAYAVPQRLVFNNQMRYVGRVTGVSYAHKVFVRNLVPTYTDVSFSFQRFPDVAYDETTVSNTKSRTPFSDARNTYQNRNRNQARVSDARLSRIPL